MKKIIFILIFFHFIFNPKFIFCQEISFNNLLNHKYENYEDFTYKTKIFGSLIYKKIEFTSIDYNNYFLKIYNNYFSIEIKNYTSFLLILDFFQNYIFNININYGYFTLNYASNFFSGIKSIFPYDFLNNDPSINFSNKIFYNFNENYNDIFQTFNNEPESFFIKINIFEYFNLFFGNIKTNDNNNYNIYGLYLNLEYLKILSTIENHNYSIKIYNKQIDSFNRIIFSINFNFNELKILLEFPCSYFYYMDYLVYFFDTLIFFKFNGFKYLFLYKNFYYKSENFFNDNFIHDIVISINKYLFFNFYMPYNKDNFKIISDNFFLRLLYNNKIIKKYGFIDYLNLEFEIYFYPEKYLNFSNIFEYTENDYNFKISLNPEICIYFTKNRFLAISNQIEIYKNNYIENKLKFSIFGKYNKINFIYYFNDDIINHMYIFSKFTIYDFNFLYIKPKENLLEISFENSYFLNSIFLKFIYIFNDISNKLYIVVGIYYDN